MRKARVKHPRMRPGDRRLLCHVADVRQSTAPRTDHAGPVPAFLTSTDVIRFLAALLICALPLGPTAAVEVTAQDSTDEYLISGATVLDQQFPDAAAAISCETCHWRIVVICESGSLDDRRGCESLPDTCDARRAEVWRAMGPDAPAVGDPAWEFRGVTCLRDIPVAVAHVSGLIPDIARQAIPPLRAGSNPGTTTITNFPTAFFSGQPADHSLPTLDIAGARVTIHVRPAWRWDFGHGQPLLTDQPGSGLRTSAVQHRFPRRGIYRVRVAATWFANYDINDATGFSVSDTITQSAAFDIRVREARRFMTIKRSTR